MVTVNVTTGGNDLNASSFNHSEPLNGRSFWGSGSLNETWGFLGLASVLAARGFVGDSW